MSHFALPAGGALLCCAAPNGAGKSSLLRALAGLTPLAAGDVALGREDALEDLPTHAQRIAWLGHLDAVKPALTAAEHVPAPAALAAVGLAGLCGPAGAAALRRPETPAGDRAGGRRPGAALAAG